MKTSVLVVDDERKIRLVLERLLAGRGYRVRMAEDGRRALAEAASEAPDLILLDLRMPGMDGLETLKRLRDSGFDGKVVIMTAFGTIPGAVEAMRAGAYDYITKPFSNNELLLTIDRALEHHRLQRDLSLARRQLEEKYSISGIVAVSRTMLELIDVVKRTAPTDAPVVIVGESGTGKELFAKAVHQHSDRRDRPFLALNCSALPANLIESELFGYMRGAFTGADHQKKGLVAQADGGTLFLDEVSELGAEAQAKLLRFAQSGEFIPLGGTEQRRVDVRIVAASNRDLERAVTEGAFRADLFYRLNVVKISIPPLRERRDDIPLLIEHFLQIYGPEYGKEGLRFDGEAMDSLQLYRWPGNVRELENVVKSALVLAEKSPMAIGDLPISMRTGIPQAPGFNDAGSFSLPEAVGKQQEFLEIQSIKKALSETGGNRTRAAERLGINRITLLRKMRQYGLR
jgi:DNA-binding NtrC family response regulator